LTNIPAGFNLLRLVKRFIHLIPIGIWAFRVEAA
jgi:hypothetical protein